MDRQLKDRLYLLVDGSFPTTELKLSAIEDEKYSNNSETLLEAALRGLKENTSEYSGKKNSELSLELYCPSQAPIGVQLEVHNEDKQKSTGFYGYKTFFMKVQYDDGMLHGNNIAWLARLEIVERFQSESRDDKSNFFRYLL